VYKRPIYHEVMKRVNEPRRFIQVIGGPRQVGKTTISQQILENIDFPAHYASADDPTLHDQFWIEEQWEIGRIRAKGGSALLILDEIQKVGDWSVVVKKLWDEDARNKIDLKVVLLGSAPLLIQRGLTESLAGRFEIIPIAHWSFTEMKEAFGWGLDEFIYFGGYPGSASLIDDEERWKRYILDSIIESTISRDILLMTRVDKPALLRRLFYLGSEYSGQIVSYNKLLGQLQDAGNTTTLAHYLDLLAGAGMMKGLSKYAGGALRRKGSSPKLQVMDNSLMSAVSGLTFDQAMSDRSFWGRLVESAVGTHLINALLGKDSEIYYWRKSNREVDFAVEYNKKVIGIEVKSSKRKGALAGMKAFADEFDVKKKLLIGGDGIPLEEFLSNGVEYYFS